MHLRPADVVTRQFPRRLFGVDPEEVKRFLAEAAATLERLNAEMARVILERSALQKTLKEAREEMERLRARLAEADAGLARYRGQEQLMAQTVLEAQRLKQDLVQASRADAERITAQARAAAAETVESSRAAAADLLRAVRARAEEAVASAERAAASRLAQIRLESERLVMDARREAREAHDEARRHVEELARRLEAFLAESDLISGGIEKVEAGQAESLRLLGETQEEMERNVLPSLRAFVRSLTADRPRAPAEPPVDGGSGAADAEPESPAALLRLPNGGPRVAGATGAESRER